MFKQNPSLTLFQVCMKSSENGREIPSPKGSSPMHVTNKRDPIKNDYTSHGVTLQETDGAKYLGVNLYKSLSWNNHIDQVLYQSFSSEEHLGQVMRKCVLCHMRTIKAHPRSLISTFVVRCLDSVICILAISKVSRF